jgi:HK97 family phage portal protein
MGFLDRFRRNRPEVKVYPRAMREVKSFPLYQLIPNWGGYTAKWSQYSTSQCLEAYKKSVWLYDCLRLRADNISGVPWVVEVKKGGEWEQTESHELVDLLAHPNPCYDLPTMMAYAMYWLDLTGDAWGTKVRNGAGRVYEWWPLFPDSMKVIQGRMSMIDGWQYQYNGKQADLPAQDVMHFKYVDPSSPYYGLSPLQAAAKAVDVDMEANNYQKVTLQNHGMPMGIFTGSDDMTQEQYEQNKEWISEQSGPEYGRKPWVASLKYQAMGNTPHELDFIDSRAMTRVEICSAYAVPPPLVGIYDDATLANIQTARRIFWMEGLIPILRKLEGQMNIQLASEYGPDVRITYDLNNVEALEQDQGEKITRAKELWSMGVPLEQINTVLELGLDTDKIEGADVGYLPSGLLPANFDAGTPEPMDDDTAAVTYEGGDKAPETPVAASAPSGPVPAEPVANTALNGAQVTALQGIVQAVADGLMPGESALQLILVSFPMVSEQQARAIITPLASFEQREQAPEPNPFEGNDE